MVFRPSRAYLLGLGAAVGLIVVVGAAMTFLLSRRTGLGWLPVGVVSVLVAAALAYLVNASRRVRLVVDETGVTMIDLFGGPYSCPAQDLAAIKLVPGYRTQNWEFVRRDGSVAFETNAGVWPRSAMEAIAQKFSVPLQLRPTDQVSAYTCPVCGYPRLAEPPQHDGMPSHEICPSCGFEFGETDLVAGKTYAQWRQGWIDAGMPWFAKQAGQDPPTGWDPVAQLKSVQTR